MINNSHLLKSHLVSTKRGKIDYAKGQAWAAEKIAGGASPEALEAWGNKNRTAFGFGVAEYVWNLLSADRAMGEVMNRIDLLAKGVAAGSKDARFELLGLLDSDNDKVVAATRKALGLSK